MSDDASKVVEARRVNRFKPSSLYRKSGCPYLLENGNYGVYLPKKFFGMKTAGNKMVIDLKTKDLRLADERIMAIGIVAQLQSCEAETF